MPKEETSHSNPDTEEKPPLTIPEQKAARVAEKKEIERKMQETRKNRFLDIRERNETKEEEKEEVNDSDEEEVLEKEESGSEKIPVSEDSLEQDHIVDKVVDDINDNSGDDDEFLDFIEDVDEKKDDTNLTNVEEEEDKSGIRKRLQEEGQARKKAEADLITSESENERLQSKITALESSQKNLEAKNVNWNTHESVAPLWEKFDTAIQRGATGLPDESTAKNFLKDQDSLVIEYFNRSEKANTAQAKVAEDIKFRKELSERYSSDDGDEANGGQLLESVKNALEVYLQIEDTKSELVEKFKEGHLSMGIEAYDSEINIYADVFKDMGVVEDDIIEADPLSPHSVVGSKLRDDPDFKKSAVKDARLIQELVFGLRPLSQDEMDTARRRASNRGVSLDDYLNLRKENYHRKRAEFLNEVFVNRQAMKEYSSMRKIFSAVEQKKEARRASKTALKKAASPKQEEIEEKKPVKARDREYVPPSQRFAQ